MGGGNTFTHQTKNIKMRKKAQIGLILCMIFLSKNSFGQTMESGSKKIKTDKITETYLDLVLNVVSTNINYGMSNSVYADYKKLVFGGQVGVSFQGGITPNFSLVSELYFIMKGDKLTANNPLTVDKSVLRFYTLELPVLARVHIGKLYMNAGPSIAYNLYGTSKIGGSTSDLSFNDSDEGFKRLDAGVQFGTGYRFKAKQRNIALDIRYTYGLTNISSGQEMYNRYLNISLHLSKPWKTNPIGRNRMS
jgi:hypothetical protein